MKSYAVVDRVECKFVVCEVELLETERSYAETYYDHDTVMIDVPISLFEEIGETVNSSDIFEVEHDGETVKRVYSKNNYERQCRINVLEEIANG